MSSYTNYAIMLFHNVFHPHSSHDLHSHDTRQADNIHIESVTLPVRKRSLRYQACTIYNCDDELLYNLPFVSFKYMIKTRLLEL